MRILIGLVATLASGVALAQSADQPEEIDAATGRKIRYLERQEVIFDGVSLEGETIKPGGVFIGERPPPKFNPMIRLRKDWNVEMRESLDNMK